MVRLLTLAAMGMAGTVLASPALHSRAVRSRPSWQIVSTAFASPRAGWVAALRGPDGTIFRTTDGGFHWHSVYSWTPKHPALGLTGQKRVAEPLALTFYNAHDGLAVWYQAAGGGPLYVNVSHTTDGGERWQLMASNVAMFDGSISLGMTGPDSAVLLDGSFSGAQTLVLRSCDGGSHWSRTTWSFRGAVYQPQVEALRVINRHSLAVLTALPGVRPASAAIYDLTSSNGGTRWQRHVLSKTGIDEPRFGSGRSPGGAHWSATAQWLIASPNAGTPTGLFSYAAAAHKWEPLNTPASPEFVNMVGPTTGYLSNGTEIWKTITGGRSWRLLSPL